MMVTILQILLGLVLFSILPRGIRQMLVILAVAVPLLWVLMAFDERRDEERRTERAGVELDARIAALEASLTPKWQKQPAVAAIATVAADNSALATDPEYACLATSIIIDGVSVSEEKLQEQETISLVYPDMIQRCVVDASSEEWECSTTLLAGKSLHHGHIQQYSPYGKSGMPRLEINARDLSFTDSGDNYQMTGFCIAE